ncbi:MAG: hypothetical protein ACI9N1_000355 [Flavobacteriales bacterium]|jgi:hypothetical protein
MKKLILTQILLAFIIFTLNGQVSVNKYVLEDFGYPTSEVDWSASISDDFGNIITVGNNLVSSDVVELATTKQNAEGEVIWEKSWTKPFVANSKNYGIAVDIDSNGDIIVAGATTTDDGFNMDMVVLKYSADGTENWYKLITSNDVNYDLLDIPSAIRTNSIGDIYVTGITQSLSSNTDFYTLKLEKNSGQIIWSEKYDNNGGFDIPTTIELNDLGHPIVSGFTSLNGTNWNIKTLRYNSMNGGLENEATFNDAFVGNTPVPIGLKVDSNGNYFFLSQVEGINNSNVKLTKLDADFNVIWNTVFDLSGQADEPSCLTLTLDNTIVVTVTSTNSLNQRELITLTYNSDGGLLWKQSRKPSNYQENVRAVKCVVSEDGVFSIGEVSSDGNTNLVVVKYDLSGKILWEQRHGNNHDFIVGANVYEGQLYVTAKHQFENESKYYSLRFEEYHKNNPIIYDTSTGIPLNRANELIVKFNSQVLKIDNIDNLDLTFGPAEQWITEDALLKLEKRVDLREATFIRIFKTLKSTHLTSISRLGEEIPIPDFYATFIIDFPDGTDLSGEISNMESLFPTIKYAHRNYLATLSDVPNDPLYENQTSLHNSNSTIENDINIEPFWEEVTGKPYIKIGILDSGLDLKHEDFELDDQTSIAVGGWDYITGASLSSLNAADQDAGGHGTRSAGIIGAVRNNELGIAGIAGGFPDGGSNLSNRGVSLYGLKLFPEAAFDLATQADAIVTSSTDMDDDPTVENDFGVHVLNAGYNLPATVSNVQALSDAIHYANRNKVSFINSSGNSGSSNLGDVSCTIPSCLDDDWVTVVSGTGTDGQYKQFTNGSPDDFFPNRGDYVDIAAPCVTELIWTTQGIDESDDYLAWNGTSAAAPHAAGVAGLLLSYLNTPDPSYGNLAPEDIEFVMEETATATDAPLPIPNIRTGYGRLNAGASFNLIHKPSKSLVHLGTDNDPNTKSSNQVNSNITINLTEPYDNAMGQSFNSGTYTADVYRISATVDHATLTTDNIILHSWERHSSSTLFPLAVDGGDLIPHEKVNLTAVSDNEALLEGFVYELKDGDNSLGWIPFEVTDLNSAELCYSLIIQDKISTSIDNVENTYSISVLPNPTSDLVEINISNLESKLIDIQLIDAFGREVLNIYSGEIHHSLIKNVDLSTFANGLYYIVTTTDKDKIIRPIVKQ